MSALTLFLVGLVTPLALVSLLNLATAPRLHRVPVSPAAWRPRVSVLVPARDEADNLRSLLPALRATRYRPLEVLVLDDGSSDGTAALARRLAGDRFGVVPGTEPPAGWTGKNWACDQLARLATGDVLIFCDADVRPGPDAIGRTVAALESTGADLLTAFPRHERGGWFEEAVVPIVTKLPVAALLPLGLVSRTRAVSLAVGNGQWLAWRKEAYERAGGHAAVRSTVLEDVRLARAAKLRGLRLAPYIATRDLAVRMYRNPRETWDGFAKNLYLLVGGHPVPATIAVAVLGAAAALPILLPALQRTPAALLPLAGVVAARMAAARLFDEPVRSVALYPVGMVIVAALVVASAARHRRGTVVWKRRTLELERTA